MGVEGKDKGWCRGEGLTVVNKGEYWEIKDGRKWRITGGRYGGRITDGEKVEGKGQGWEKRRGRVKIKGW